MWGKKKTEEQKLVEQIKDMMPDVFSNIEKQVSTDKRFLTLEPIEILLGVITLMYEEKVRAAMDLFLLTGKVPEGPIGETIKKQAHMLQQQVGMIAEQLPKTHGRVVSMDLAQAEKDFDNEDVPNKKVIH